MRKKLRGDRRGFTLVEMLCTVIVLLLISGLMAIGVRLGVGSLRKLVMESEAQVLCSTLETVVSDELRYSGTTSPSSDPITFFSQNYGEEVGFTTNEEGQVLLGGNKLLSAKSYPYGLRAAVELTGYEADSRIFSVTVTVTDAEGSTMDQAVFQVQQLNTPASGE